jgi:hypothetical protein
LPEISRVRATKMPTATKRIHSFDCPSRYGASHDDNLCDYNDVPPPVEPSRQEVVPSPAARLREITGLDAGRLGNVFGVSRIAYQGWLGEVQPTLARREHLLEVLTFIEEAWQRLGATSAVRDWLLTPVASGGPKPLDLLRERRYNLARGFLLRRRTGTETVKHLPVRQRGDERLSEERTREDLELLNPRYHTVYSDGEPCPHRVR